MGLMGLMRLVGLIGLLWLVGSLVPEEILSLGFLLAWRLGAEDGFQRVGVVACVPRFCADGHWRRREVLHLFELESQFPCDVGQLRHILFVAAGVAGDEVRNNLLVEMLLAADAVEDALEVEELLERRFAHQSQHAVAGMFGCHFQSSADVACDEFACVLAGSLVGSVVLAVIKQQVVAHAAAYEALLDAGQGIDSVVDVEQSGVAGVEVRTDLRMYAAGSPALLAGVDVAAMHAVHIGRRSAEVAEVALEVGHVDDLFHLF